MSEFQVRRKSKKKKKGRKSRLEKKIKLKEELDRLTKENVKLQKVVITMQDEEKEAEMIEARLLQELGSLKESISNLQMEKEQEEKNLKTTVLRVKAELYDLGLSKQPNITLELLNEEPENDNYETRSKYGRQRRSDGREMKHQMPASQDTASVAGVPFYDRKIHKKSKFLKKRSHSVQERRKSGQISPRPSSNNARSDRNRRVSKRRMSTPLPKRNRKDGVDAAARAFLEIFTGLKPKLLKSLWVDIVELKNINGELVLDIQHLPRLLHKLVVYAFQQDNPDRATPTFRRTKPLITLLKLRLTPYLGSQKYITLAQFQQFPFWLEQRQEIGNMKPPKSFSSKNYTTPAQEDVRSDLRAGSACLIWSEGGQRWCEGQVTATNFYKDGEWLVVRYFTNSKSLEKEVQRYSDVIRVFGQ